MQLTTITATPYHLEGDMGKGCGHPPILIKDLKRLQGRQGRLRGLPQTSQDVRLHGCGNSLCLLIPPFLPPAKSPFLSLSLHRSLSSLSPSPSLLPVSLSLSPPCLPFSLFPFSSLSPSPSPSLSLSLSLSLPQPTTTNSSCVTQYCDWLWAISAQACCSKIALPPKNST